MLDAEGLDGLTLRKVATVLGVRPGALYRHFASKQELLDLVAATILEENLGPVTPPMAGQTWTDWLTVRSRALREALLAHRDGARLVAGARPVADRRPTAEHLVRALTLAGFPPERVLPTLLAVKHYVIGAVQEEQSLLEARAASDDEHNDRDRYARYPNLARALLAQPDERAAQFEFGLTALLAGIAASVGVDPEAPARSAVLGH
jgi:TetR/AcrR family tetracycline transcriptional repressor